MKTTLPPRHGRPPALPGSQTPPDAHGHGLPADPFFAASLKKGAGKAAALLRALANPDRLMLVCHLVDGEKTVGQLGALACVDQPSLSQQLGVLRQEGLVATRREGKHIHYRIGSREALAVLQTLHALYCAPKAPAPH
jgi:ArsR family transcriptional regulator